MIILILNVFGQQDEANGIIATCLISCRCSLGGSSPHCIFPPKQLDENCKIHRGHFGAGWAQRSSALKCLPNNQSVGPSTLYPPPPHLCTVW